MFKKYSALLFVQWIAGSSLLALYMLRCFMIGYVDATSFSAVDSPAYQAGSYVALGCFIAVQMAVLAGNIIKNYNKKSNTIG